MVPLRKMQMRVWYRISDIVISPFPTGMWTGTTIIQPGTMGMQQSKTALEQWLTEQEAAKHVPRAQQLILVCLSRHSEQYYTIYHVELTGNKNHYSIRLSPWLGHGSFIKPTLPVTLKAPAGIPDVKRSDSRPNGKGDPDIIIFEPWPTNSRQDS